MENNTPNIETEMDDLSAVLAAMRPVQLPYQVPAGYFEHFPVVLLQKITAGDEKVDLATELQALSPLLSGLRKEMPFTIPEEYFSNLGEEIPQRMAGEDLKQVHRPADVVTMTPGKKRPFFRFAAAAAIITAVGLSLLFWRSNDKGIEGIPAASYASGLPELSDDILSGYLHNSPSVFDAALVDSDDVAFFDQALFKLGGEKDLVNLLTNVPDEDLDNYESNFL